MLACGTTTAEVKSGYGLETDAELRMLRAIRALALAQPIELAATFMGAHEISGRIPRPPGDYVRLIIEEMIPAVAAERRSPSGATCSASAASSRPKNHGTSSRPGCATASRRAFTPTSSR